MQVEMSDDKDPPMVEHDEHEFKRAGHGLITDGYDAVAAVILGGAALWFINAGHYEALRLWIKSMLFGG